MLERFIENNFNSQQLEYLIRILIACICGLVIGYERSKRQKEAGIRTHIILAMGCAIMTIVSKYGFMDMREYGIDADASRLAANIITGIGFLGAGVIFVRGGSIRGLTTAAGIWTTSGIGLAIGSGMYTLGIATTLILIFVQIIIHKLFPSLESLETIELTIKAKKNSNVLERIRALLKEHRVIVNTFKSKKGNQELEIRFNLRFRKGDSFDEIIALINNDDDVYEVGTNI